MPNASSVKITAGENANIRLGFPPRRPSELPLTERNSTRGADPMIRDTRTPQLHGSRHLSYFSKCSVSYSWGDNMTGPSTSGVQL